MKKYVFLLVFVLSIVVLFGVFGNSFAIFNYNSDGNVSNSLNSGTIDILFNDDNSNLYLSSINALEDVYTFSISNNGTLSSKYKLMVDYDDYYYLLDSCNKIDFSNINYSLECDGKIVATGKLSDFIVNNVINSKEIHEYKLVINTDSNLEDYHFHGKIDLDYVVFSSNFDS